MLAQYPLPKRNTVSPNRFLPPAKMRRRRRGNHPPPGEGLQYPEGEPSACRFSPLSQSECSGKRTLLMVQKNSPTTVFPVDTPPRIPYKFLHATRE